MISKLLQKIKSETQKGYNSYKNTVSKNILNRYVNSMFVSEELWPGSVTCHGFMPYRNFAVEGAQNRIDPV